MPTLNPVDKSVIHEPPGICPNCLGVIKRVALLSGLFTWELVERCDCKYINKKIKWPFEEDATFDAVKPAEFFEYGIILDTGRRKLRSDIEEMYEELYADLYDEDKYMDDVDYGWERSHYG